MILFICNSRPPLWKNASPRGVYYKKYGRQNDKIIIFDFEIQVKRQMSKDAYGQGIDYQYLAFQAPLEIQMTSVVYFHTYRLK